MCHTLDRTGSPLLIGSSKKIISLTWGSTVFLYWPIKSYFVKLIFLGYSLILFLSLVDLIKSIAYYSIRRSRKRFSVSSCCGRYGNIVNFGCDCWHMTLFTVVAAESIVIVVKEVIIRHTLFNGRTQRRDSLKWYEEVGVVNKSTNTL